jgi:hypothetical protein
MVIRVRERAGTHSRDKKKLSFGTEARPNWNIMGHYIYIYMCVCVYVCVCVCMCVCVCVCVCVYVIYVNQTLGSALTRG